MSLDLDKGNKYMNPYETNQNYLYNMTSLQMKLLKGMGKRIEWGGDYIRTDLRFIPVAWPSNEYAKNTVEDFIIYLNKRITEL